MIYSDDVNRVLAIQISTLIILIYSTIRIMLKLQDIEERLKNG